MAYTDPVMTVLQQGGSTSNQSAQVASQFMSNATNALNSAGSLSMKMIALLDQEEARKQQQLLQTTQLMHNIYQDNLNTNLKQQQLENQQEQFNKSYELDNNRLNELKTKDMINEHNIALQNGGTYRDTDGTIKEIPLNESLKYKLAEENNAVKIANANKNRYTTTTAVDPNTGSLLAITTDKMTGQKTIKPLTLQEPTHSNIDIHAFTKNNKSFNSKYPMQNYKTFKTYLDSNHIEENKFFSLVKSDNVNGLFDYLSNGKNNVEGDAIALSKLNSSALTVIKRTNPSMYVDTLDAMKDKLQNIIRHSIDIGKPELVTKARQSTIDMLGSDYNKYGFDKLFDTYANKYNISFNDSQKTLSNMNESSINDYTGTSGNLLSNMFYGHNKDIWNQTIRNVGTPVFTSATLNLLNDEGTNFSFIKGLFHKNDSLFRLANDPVDQRMLFADELNINYLDKDVRQAIEEANKATLGSIIGSEKGTKELEQFRKNNPNFNYDTKQTMPYELYKANKDLKVNLSDKYSKVYKTLQKPKYKKLINDMEDYFSDRMYYYKNNLGYDDKKAMEQTFRDAVSKFGENKVKKAIVYDLLLLRTTANTTYTGK